MTSQQRSFALIGILSIISGSLGVVNKIGVQEIPPLGFVASRVILSFIFISPYLFKINKSLSIRKIKLLVFSLFATLNIGFYIIGIKHTNVSIAVVLASAIPAFTAIISYFLYHEKINPKKGIGILLGLLGSGIVALSPLIGTSYTQLGSLYGNFFIILSVITFSFHTALSKKAQRQFSPINITAAFIVVATILLTPLAIIEMQFTGNWLLHLSWVSIGSMLYVSLIGTILFYFLYQKAVKNTSPVIASMMLYLTPIVGIFLAVLVLGETLTFPLILGSIVSLLGIWLVTG